MSSNQPKFKRALLKLSGEALAGQSKTGIEPSILKQIASEIAEVRSIGVQIAVVVGAGNIFRGSLGEKLGIDRVKGDYMGMLGTVINSLALEDALEKLNVPASVMTSVEMKDFAEHFTIRDAIRKLEDNQVVIAAGGTGHPFFTTDTASALRAIEIGADCMLKATRVDGVYTADPEKDSSAVKIDEIKYIHIIEKNLRVLDFTCVSLCMDNALPIIVFDLFNKGSLVKAVMGEKIGTTIS
jgi:uridylate kinase